MVSELNKIRQLPKSEENRNAAKLLKMMIDQPHITPSDLSTIKSPTMVIGGDRDLIKPTHTLHIFECIPNACLWILPNSGHGTLIDYAAEFNTKVDAFFRLPQKTKQ